ncbi:hypothetical protein GLOIN_2v1786555 [Rhizophagus irregularis DAOM 181602=DAOM 197198]|nr:hypothetical protein GLOIN_2v1786555 [Rhizophagus irregularis DAOM 181602=DAOM 197198]
MSDNFNYDTFVRNPPQPHKTKQVNSTGGVSLFIEKSLASHVQDFVSHSSRILSVDLYFKGNKLLIFFTTFGAN